MQSKKIKVSVIIVNYKVKRELFECISSIITSKDKVSYEIIVVDNDTASKIGKELADKFPGVTYIKSQNNSGYGGGNNLGSKSAKGEYLFFLNPDTKILNGALGNLYSFCTENKNIGIASPVFLDNELNPFRSQGSRELTPKNILFSQSFLRKIFPSKNIYNNSILNSWGMKDSRRTEVVPGAAMMISANLFRKIGEFDEKLFLYFEENDISRRVSNLGYKLFIVPSAKIIHKVGKSTKKLTNIENIYSKSRYLYLKKHYGMFNAIFARLILSLNKKSILLLLILDISLLLRIVNIENTMPFIGDQGWFYLSARDMIINGQIPLVGIASSHPWLHQGPLWTYMLAGVFGIFGFNPLNGAYLTVALGIITVLLMYIVGSEMFSKRVGLVSAFLYATSPLAIIHSRTPYHTSPIPLFTLLFIFSLHKWIKGNSIFFPLSILFLSILYNFELATSTLWFVLLIILTYGIWKKKSWVQNMLNKKILIYSIAAFLIPMIPILIYDFSHNFPQTLKFAAWIGYRILRFFGFPGVHGEDTLASQSSIIEFSFFFYKQLTFAVNGIAAFVILIFSFGALLISSYSSFREKIYNVGLTLLTLWVTISLVGYFVNKTPSEAYLPILFPALIFLVAFSFEKIMKIRILSIPIILIVVFISFMNSYFFISENYSENGYSFSKRLNIAKEIIRRAEGKQYNLAGTGEGSQFASFTMNYEYLTWWLGHPPVKSRQKLVYFIEENRNNIFLKNE